MRYKQLIPATGYSAVYIDRETGSGVNFYPLVFWAIKENELTDSVVGLVMDLMDRTGSRGCAELVEVNDDGDFISFCRSEEEKERYWEDIAKEMLECEEIVERREQQEREQGQTE